MSMTPPTRPALRYHGGKWILAPKIIAHFPRHRVYTEAFGGGASVLLRKARCYAEVYNDLDGEVVNFFRVVRDQGDRLRELIAHTPFAREEFALSYQRAEDPVEQARRTVVRSFMGFGSSAIWQKTGFRSNSSRSGTTPAHDWVNYAEAMPLLIERMRGVVVENVDASAILLRHDKPTTLHYVDPPYVLGTRNSGTDYRHEMSDTEHETLFHTLDSLKGMVVLSGYRCDLYDHLYRDWLRVDINALADGARPRVESMWLNRAAAAQRQPTLF